MVEELQEWSRERCLPEYITPKLLEKLRAGLMNNELKVGDTVYVITDKYSPTIQKGEAGTIIEELDGCYRVKFDVKRLWYIYSVDIGRTPHDF